MSKLTIGVASDDIINVQFDEIDDEIGAPQLFFNVTLPDGSELPFEVDYGMNGWEFKVDLPAGSTLVVVVPEEREPD